MNQLVALFLGIAVAGLVACGAASKSTAPSPAVARTPIAAGPAQDPRAGEIEKLAAAIDADLAKLQLPRPAPPTAGTSAMSAVSEADIVAPSADPACHPGPSDTCEDVCGLGESICKNAKRICEIASELAGDAWAAEKCASGKASCDAARERCCGCL